MPRREGVTESGEALSSFHLMTVKLDPVLIMPQIPAPATDSKGKRKGIDGLKAMPQSLCSGILLASVTPRETGW